MSKQRIYKVIREDGKYASIEVDAFKKAVENALRNWIKYDHPYRIEQRCYKDGRWELRIRTCYYPNTPQYSHTHKLRWDTDEDIEDILGNRSKVNLSEEIFSRFCLGK